MSGKGTPVCLDQPSARVEMVGAGSSSVQWLCVSVTALLDKTYAHVMQCNVQQQCKKQNYSCLPLRAFPCPLKARNTQPFHPGTRENGNGCIAIDMGGGHKRARGESHALQRRSNGGRFKTVRPRENGYSWPKINLGQYYVTPTKQREGSLQVRYKPRLRVFPISLAAPLFAPIMVHCADVFLIT